MECIKKIDFLVLDTPRRQNIKFKGAYVAFYPKFLEVVQNYRADIEDEENRGVLVKEFVYERQALSKTRELYFSMERCTEEGSEAKFLVIVEMNTLEFADFESAKKMYDALLHWKYSE